jgi:hypothetical protein
MDGIQKVTQEHGAHYPMSVSTPEACRESDLVAQYFHETFPWIKTVIDVGCCGGHFILSLLRQGVMTIGVDAHQDAPPCLGAPILLRDATLELDVPLRADAVICWEMAEHVPAEKADVLAENLTKMSDIIFFSAGVPGYDGAHGHQNCQVPEYWEKKFDNLGFSVDSILPWRQALKELVEAKYRESYLWWIWSDQSRLYKKR